MVTKIKKICDRYFLFIGESETSVQRVWMFKNIESAMRVAEVIKEDSEAEEHY